MRATGSDPSAIALFDLIVSYRITAMIYVAARLGIADLLADGPKRLDELAIRSGAHPPSLERLLRALVAVGICRRTADGECGLTETGAHLAGGARQSLKAYVLFEGDMVFKSWEDLLASVRTGKTAAALAGFDNGFDQMGRDPEAVKIFNDAMVSLTGVVAPGILAAYDFSGIGRLFDVGGGFGELLGAILRAYPSMHGAVCDLPRCSEGARKQLADFGLDGRAEFIAGDFFEAVPAGPDAIIMKSVIHDWDDECSTTILRNCRRALSRGGKVLLVERLLSEAVSVDPQDLSNAMNDLSMLRGAGGRERTEREYANLLRSAKFEKVRVIPASRFHVIEAVAT
jgi:O-methyltransferase domain/Dimerisation domain